MKNKTLSLILGTVLMSGTPALANWQYSGGRTYNPYAYDDGQRTTVSARVGATFLMAKMHNDASGVVVEYCSNGTNVFPAIEGVCTAYGSDYNYIGSGDLGTVGVNGKPSGIGFAGGLSIGTTMPDKPQWRVELGWDHFTEIEYSANPLFKGDMTLTGGAIVNVEVGSVQTTIASDVISLMAFYDFYDGYVKPLHKIIPYVGFGLGYADSKTVMDLYDPNRDLSWSADVNNFENFGTVSSNGIVQFYKSETTSTNIAALAALGLSYGISDGVFLDLGARFTYIPKVKYSLTNSDNTRKFNWVSARNMIYTNVMVGLRFEF